MMRPGNISLPNGLGLAHGPGGPVTGVAPNELTSSARRDWLSGTPWHKHVPARIEPLRLRAAEASTLQTAAQSPRE
jgi:anaerobic selenocysteine-containing dehydrogenase